jgi:hypothetical protein
MKDMYKLRVVHLLGRLSSIRTLQTYHQDSIGPTHLPHCIEYSVTICSAQAHNSIETAIHRQFRMGNTISLIRESFPGKARFTQENVPDLKDKVSDPQLRQSAAYAVSTSANAITRLSLSPVQILVLARKLPKFYTPAMPRST